MEKFIFRRTQVLFFATAILFIQLLVSCKREYINYSTTNVVNMYSFLEQDPAQYSLFKQIIDKAGYNEFLNSYGTYTLFAPTNKGVEAYLKAANMASVDAISAETAKGIVSISLVADTINTGLFTDGKMRTPSTQGQFLITGATNISGVTYTTINRQANLVQGNIRVGNGLIHVIDNVLTPAPLSLAKMLEQDSKYSIFTEALKATGFYDSLNVASKQQTNLSRKYLTVVAQTNAVFQAAGFSDFNALKNRYSKTGDPKNPTDSLYLFVAYRIFPELAYLTDVVAASSHPTLAPLEVTTSMAEGEKVLLNNDVFNGVLEPGVEIDRSLSDYSASNGVLHASASHYAIKVRKPTAVYFDLGDQPEIRRAPGVYRVLGKDKVKYALGSLADVTWIGRGSESIGLVFWYGTTSAIPSSSDWYYGGDWVQFGERFRPSSNGMNEITFKTPLLIRGRYKVWVDFKSYSGNGAPIVVSFDGQPTANTYAPNETVSDTESDAVLESRNLKRYTESPLTGSSNRFTSKMVGVINVTTTDRHFLKFTCTGDNGGPHNVDVVEFRPIDMKSQILPKLGRDGTLKY